ncbi:MAG: DUF805 domain-containing protein [Alphaproteobacteria bacterium]|nr:DUF805 domain-containing protein [Alphaproteobacteria bacterium]
MDARYAIEVFKTVLTKHYVDFEGRAGLAEFWYFALVSFLASFVCNFIGLIATTNAFGVLYQLAVLLPSLAVSVRRLHDLDKSGWWILMPLAPYVVSLMLLPFALSATFSTWYSGGIGSPLFVLFVQLFVAEVGAYGVLLFWLIQPGTAGANRFGDAQSLIANADDAAPVKR